MEGGRLENREGLRIAAHLLTAVLGVVLLGVGAGVTLGVIQSDRDRQRATDIPALSGDAVTGSAGTDVNALVKSPIAQRTPPLALVKPMPAPGPSTEETPQARPTPDAPQLPGFGRPHAPHAGEPPAERRRPAARRRTEARLAVVIDDLGYNLRVPEELLRLRQPITFSILPDLRYSQRVAELARQGGREFIVHLPMQPFGFPAQNPGPLPLLLAQSPQETLARLRGYLESLPGAAGASNHMGSAYSYDAARMEIVEEELARRNLFFLNSKTSAAPEPGDIARRRGFAYLERDVFLDNEISEPQIAHYLEQAVRTARQRGHAIAIGHPYPETYRVLRRRLPRLASEGVTLVELSRLLDGRGAP